MQSSPPMVDIQVVLKDIIAYLTTTGAFLRSQECHEL